MCVKQSPSSRVLCRRQQHRSVLIQQKAWYCCACSLKEPHIRLHMSHACRAQEGSAMAVVGWEGVVLRTMVQMLSRRAGHGHVRFCALYGPLQPFTVEHVGSLRMSSSSSSSCCCSCCSTHLWVDEWCQLVMAVLVPRWRAWAIMNHMERRAPRHIPHGSDRVAPPS